MTPAQKKKAGPLRENKKVTLKTVARHLGWQQGRYPPLNNSPARSIPEHTKKRILAAARAELPPGFLRGRCG
jgi:hypothetical protein